MDCEKRETCECHKEGGPKAGGHWKHHEAMKAHLEGHGCCGGGHMHAYVAHAYQAKGESLEELEERLLRLKAETLTVQENIAKLKGE